MTRLHMRLLALPVTAFLLAATAALAPAVHAKPAAAHKAGKMVSLVDGLTYQDIVVGKGPSPKRGQLVTVSYVGTLTNGKVFDASARHGGTFKFPIGAGQVIPGWDQGVMTMKVGGKRKLIIPPALGYGGHPMPGIPPDSTLIFLVRLVKIR